MRPMLSDGRPAVALVATGSVIRVRFCTSSTSTWTAFYSRAVGLTEVTTTAERRSIDAGAGDTCATGAAEAAMKTVESPTRRKRQNTRMHPPGATHVAKTLVAPPRGKLKAALLRTAVSRRDI
jgi:hypothetical protein